MVTMAQIAANWRNIHTLTWIARIHSHTYINNVTTTFVRSASSASTQFRIEFLI